MPIDRLFQEAREVHLGLRQELSLTREELATIASQPALLVRFRTRLKTEVNDPELRLLILAYLQAAAEDLDHSSRVSEMIVERIGWTIGSISVMNVAAGAIITAAGVFASVSVIGGVALIGGGMLCLGAVGWATGKIKGRALKDKANADRLRFLVDAAKEEDK
ncbi:hypothetical protein [Brevundimonas sp.]|uniref:hypothetical protein n=1 Tax=Brevundimonas sp. TaxID=1871086 RepID=UPI002AB7F878|nr:hypothetical protein [Brevundimonas sp.]MDZ4362618.1 hypothetical protein [Brevundimonas sp.]